MSLFGGKSKEETEAAKPAKAPSGATGARPSNAPRSVAEPVASNERKAPAAPARAQGSGSEMANIGKSVTVKGDLTGNEDLTIEGTVEGRIDLPNNQLTIGAEGTVKAEVKAKSVVVIGHVNGNVTATEKAEVQQSGIVEGDLSAPRLIVAEGARLNGTVTMGDNASKPSAATPPPPKAAAGGEAA